MKIEKLELLLNKVVEYNKPDGFHYKGFLYKDDYQGYYIKVVEAIDSTVIEVNSKLRVNNDDEQYITQADKPKLMRVSLKSWHYRLIKFVLCSKAPTPTTMQNGCPYFWLLIFSLFACSFVALWKIFVFLILLIPKILFYGLEKLTIAWMESIDDGEAYDYYWRGSYTNENKMPVTAKLFFDRSNNDFMDYYLLEKYKLDGKIGSNEYQKKKEELKLKWESWREERIKMNEKHRNEELVKEANQQRRRIEYERKKAERTAKWDARTKPIEDAINKVWTSIRKAFTFKGDVKTFIKRTKQAVGALITLLLLGVAFFVVESLAYLLMAFIDISIEYWYVYAIIVGIVAVAGIIYVLYLLFTGWAQTLINKYKSGKRVWYVEPFIYLVYYPLKYVCLGIAYGLFYIICIPIKYIFYNFLWKIILVPIGKFIWKVLKAFGRGIVNSTGVFGEYFNASYTDYCPGIEWVDTDKEE